MHETLEAEVDEHLRRHREVRDERGHAAIMNAQGAGSRTKALLMAFKLLAMADERWRKVNGSELLPLLTSNF